MLEDLNAMVQAELTYWEKAVWKSFNPWGLSEVNDIKTLYATIINKLNVARNLTNDLEKKRLLSIAITEAQTAQMWAVKSITWNL